MSPAATIAAVIEAAATRHETPVDPNSLLNIKLAKIDGYVRSRLNAVIAYHLHHNHKIPECVIAKAYKASRQTIYYRRMAAIRLVKKSPWKQTYLSLP